MNVTLHPLAPNYETLVALHPDPNDQLSHLSNHATAIEGNFEGITVHLAAHDQQPIRNQINAARARCAAATVQRATNPNAFNNSIQRALQHLNTAYDSIAQHQEQHVAAPLNQNAVGNEEENEEINDDASVVSQRSDTTRESIVSLDSQGTQSSHESIAINGGAVGPLFHDPMEGEDVGGVDNAPPQPAFQPPPHQAVMANDMQVEDLD